SEFVVRLPLSSAESKVLSAESKLLGARHSALGTQKRVLVVDDNADAAHSLAAVLRHWGHDVRVCHDGPSALAAAGAQVPDVVLRDVGLPVMDGYELARRLRAGPATAGAVLVALTGYGRDEDRQRTHAAGCDFHLVKPVDPDEVRQLLAQVPGRA